MDRDELRARLEDAAAALAAQREAITTHFAEQAEGWMPNTSVYDALTSTGSPVLAPVLAAEAQVLAALAGLHEEVHIEVTDEPEWRGEAQVAAERAWAEWLPPDDLARFARDGDLRQAYLDGYSDGITTLLGQGAGAETRWFGHRFRLFVQWLDRAPTTSFVVGRLERAQLRHRAASQP